MKIVINTCYGGFSLSPAVMEELGFEGEKAKYGYIYNEDFGLEGHDEVPLRSHPRLIAAIEKVGVKEAGGGYSDLRIVEVPDEGVDTCYIDEYDGRESVVWSSAPIHTVY